MSVQGKRVFYIAPHEMMGGDYGKWNLSSGDGNWYAVPPETDLVANLASHDITEHDDGTITVSPSILVSDGNKSWHGFLKRGVWELA